MTSSDLIAAGLINFHNKYKVVVDSWALYDGTLTPPKLIEWSQDYEYKRHSIIP